MKKNPRFRPYACTSDGVKKPVNFKQILEDIIAGKKVTENTLIKTMQAAADWQICSCGHLCELIPRGKDHHAPIDNVLESLGADFPMHIDEIIDAHNDDDQDAMIDAAKVALECHLAIEDRAKVILDEMFTKKEWVAYINDPEKFKETHTS